MTEASVLHIRQGRRAAFRALTAEQAVILRVRSGAKRVTVGARTLELAPGKLGVLPARLPMTIENRPAPGGLYIATAIALDADLVARLGAEGFATGDPLAASDDDRAVAAFDRAVVALDDPLLPPALRLNAVREVVLWLAEAGFGFGPERPARVSDRLRGLIAAAPDAAWSSAEAARALAVSEATLRRRLAADGTTFGDVLIDVRMSMALGLLQTTVLPINRVALEVGYASPSRFAVRFRQRFGVTPSHLRAGVTDERIGTADARPGTAPRAGRR